MNLFWSSSSTASPEQDCILKFYQNEERYEEEEEHDGNSLTFEAYRNFSSYTLSIWSINLGIVYKLSDLQLPDLKTKNYNITSGYNMFKRIHTHTHIYYNIMS